MAQFKNLDELDRLGHKGDWCFLNKDQTMAIRYDDNSFLGTVVIPIAGPGAWQWNGSKELPTLTPSILVKDNPDWSIGWHGYLTDGKLITV